MIINAVPVQHKLEYFSYHLHLINFKENNFHTFSCIRKYFNYKKTYGRTNYLPRIATIFKPGVLGFLKLLLCGYWYACVL